MQCVAGTYASSTGQTLCQPCAGCGANTVVLASCQAGSSYDNSACACVAGYYMLSGCAQCPAHTTSAQGGVGVVSCQCLAGYACSYTKTLTLTLFLNFNNTPAPTTAAGLLSSPEILSIAVAAGVPVANIQVVGIIPVNPNRRLLDATHQVILTISRVDPARAALRRSHLVEWGEVDGVVALKM